MKSYNKALINKISKTSDKLYIRIYVCVYSRE